MNKSRFNVLVVEDDATQAKALDEALTRHGYSVVVCNTSVQALSQAQRMEFHCLVVDCMLPRMNGVDLVEEIVPLMPEKPTVLLISGIFKDREFVRDATNRTGAAAFLFKPVNLAELLAKVDESLASFSGPETPPVMRLYGSEDFSDQGLVKLIEVEPTIHAFHLPMLYQRILQTGLSGELTLIAAEGDVCSVSFYEGQVYSVKTPDKESYFGSLAVSHGFVSAEEVISALKARSEKPIGERLIESMSLSPHAIHVIVEEQMALRLSQTIHDDVVSMQWVSRQLPHPTHVLPARRFESLLEDWLESKLTPEWIISTLMAWGAFHIEGDWHPDLEGKPTIEDLFANSKFSTDEDLKAIFRALALGHAFMGARGEETRSFNFLESRLDQMAADFKHQNYFQILGVSEKAQAREVSKAFEGLKEAFDPEMLPANCPVELREKCRVVFDRIEKARAVLADDMERMRYLQILRSQRDQIVIESEPIFRAAILELYNGHFTQAGQKFQMLLDKKIEFKDLRAYRLWAGLNESRAFNGIRLDQIPPEERHSAPYMMAKSVYFRAKGQYKKAVESLRTGHMLDPRMQLARYEVRQLVHEMEKRNAPRDLMKEAHSLAEIITGKRKSA